MASPPLPKFEAYVLLACSKRFHSPPCLYFTHTFYMQILCQTGKGLKLSSNVHLSLGRFQNSGI
jgi:hypothetical protein